MSMRKYAFTLSAILSIGTAVLFMTKDMNYGVDFLGGSLIEVQAKAPAADAGDVRARLGELNLGDVQVQEFGSQRELLIKIESQDGGDNAEQSAVEKARLRACKTTTISVASKWSDRRFRASSPGPARWACLPRWSPC